MAFEALISETIEQPPLRRAITDAYCLSERESVLALVPGATLAPAQQAQARATATRLIEKLRARPVRNGVEALMREYVLSTAEGVALMCLAEALLRIPDAPTRDALIRDKIGGGDWRAHLGASPSIFVNAASWGLMLTGRLSVPGDAASLGDALSRLAARAGQPVIRRAVDLAMRMMGGQFVMGDTIGQALARAAGWEARGFRYSYDMLGEAALTTNDAARYFTAYESAITSMGAAAHSDAIDENPGISIKLSALHPRYCRAQRARVLAELWPRLRALAILARAQNIGINIDAEEADRLDLSLDLLEALCADPALAGWDGIGFVVQAYQKRAPFVLDYCIERAKRTNHRLMIRLVKGAYWDSEIKRAQIDGIQDFPVFTRKTHTDISYLACARKLLEAGRAIYPQFATHNALTLASVHALAGDIPADEYEFQCLHGMGEPLYEAVIGAKNLGCHCRIYAPVGGHETLLAYLVRRLLENGTNTSFVNQLTDPSVSMEDLLCDPAAMAMLGTPHDKIYAPPDLFGVYRKNSKGTDLSNESTLRDLAVALRAVPCAPSPPVADRAAINLAFTQARDAAMLSVAQRAQCLSHAAYLLEQNPAPFLAPLVEEARKTIPNAISELREAVDYLRYYAAQSENFQNASPLGVVVCISPWNFPLAIFLGQIAGALAAGNTVLAKPAEETPRIAQMAGNLLHEAGFPKEALHVLQGDGATGAALVEDTRAQAVIFTGSFEAAKHIQTTLAQRTRANGKPIPLIAETGGQNAMLVDSSALPEQVVGDILFSAFDAAGQRCSSLRLLCLEEAAAPRVLTLLKEAMRELQLGAPDQLSTDIGPVITEAARSKILNYIEEMRKAGYHVTQIPAPDTGCFVPPTLIEIQNLTALGGEVFGPVLHVLVVRRTELEALLADINAMGYGLTFGLHTRIDAMVQQLCTRTDAGNIYVNRNMVGAVVGVQPFGGNGLSGTGPKAGGPLYLRRLLESAPVALPKTGELPGPVGERNTYALLPRKAVLCLYKTQAGRQAQLDAVEQTNGCAVFSDNTDFDSALLEGDAHAVLALNAKLAARPGPIISLHALSVEEIAAGARYDPAWLFREQVISLNTAAAGGNASLMTLD